MHSALGDCVRHARLEAGLNLQQAAGRMGYRNLNRGARRLQQLETDGDATPDFIERVIEALGIDRAHAIELDTADEKARRAEWEAWASEPVPPVVVLILDCHWFAQPAHELPAGTTPEHAEAIACAMARDRGYPVYLKVDRRRSVWIDQQGHVTHRHVKEYPESTGLPFGRIGNKAFAFRF